MGSFLAVLGAIPKLIDLFSNVFAWIQKISGNDPQGFIVRAGEAFDKLEKSHGGTDAQKAEAARAIRDLISRT